MAEGEVTLEDIMRIIELTQSGELRWIESESYAAYFAVDANWSEQTHGSRNLTLENLLGIRLGFIPNDFGLINYLRLWLYEGQQYYVDRESPADQYKAANTLLALVRKAVRLGGLLISSKDPMLFCPICEEPTPHRALVDRPYGFADSERYTCTKCESSIPLHLAAQH